MDIRLIEAFHKISADVLRRNAFLREGVLSGYVFRPYRDADNTPNEQTISSEEYTPGVSADWVVELHYIVGADSYAVTIGYVLGERTWSDAADALILVAQGIEPELVN